MSQNNEMVNRNEQTLQNMMNMAFYPAPFEETSALSSYIRMPLSQISTMGTAFETLSSALRNVISEPGTTSGLYRVTIPKGTHLARFKDGSGYLGTALSEAEQISAQARLNPVLCNPSTVFMAATLANIDKKLDTIQELQQEMMDFLVQKERAELRGNLVFLSDLLANYRYNWNNELYKNSAHIKVLDIRQTAEQKILFYRDRIASDLKKKGFLHSERDAQRQIEQVRSAFQEYQLALYIQSFSSFLDVMLVGNYASDYLRGIRQKIEDYAFQYRELYTKSYDYLESYYTSSVQSTLLRGLRKVSTGAGEAIAKVPVLSKGPVDEALIEAGSKLGQTGKRKTIQRMRKMVAHQGGCVRPFLDNLETIERIYSNDISIVFNQEEAYIGIAEI